MQQTKEALFAKGTIGQVAFLLRWILVVIPVPTLIFAIYYMAISISGIWKESNGSNIFVGNFFLVIFAIIAIVLAVFMCLGIMQTTNLICHLFIVDTIVGFIVGFIILSLATEQKFSLYTENLVDYCIRHAELEFCVQNDRYSIQKYVKTRTTAAYGALSGVLAPWIVSFISFLVIILAVPEADPGTPRPDLDQNLKSDLAPTTQLQISQDIDSKGTLGQTNADNDNNLAIQANEEEDYSAYSYGGVDDEELIEKKQIKVAEA